MVRKDSGTAFVAPSKIEQPIDIIVPTHNRIDETCAVPVIGRFELTVRCINALYNNTTAPFHLIIVDDSTDPITPIYFQELQKVHDNVTFIHSDKPYTEGNQFFNIGFKHCRTPYVATVMNSLTVEPDWEIVALNVLKDKPEVGIVGLKCLFPSGSIESAGITMIGYTPVDIGRGLASHRQTALYECPAVQWAFAIVRLEAVLGKISEGIFNGFRGWDDIDNSFVLRAEGWKIIYCGYGAGYHYPRATRGSNTTEAVRENKENARAFYKRWGYWEEFKKRNPNEPSPRAVKGEQVKLYKEVKYPFKENK